MNILVTGHAGFIGSNLTKSLCDLGHNVIGVDNFSTGYLYNIDPRVKWYNGDICNGELVDKIFKNNKIDAVYHLAAKCSIVKSNEDPEGYIKTNVIGSQIILQACAKYGVKRLVYAGSMCAYGNLKPPFKIEEPYENLKPVSPYGETKLRSEIELLNFGKAFGINITCLRGFNVYGDRQDLKNPYQGVVAIFMGAIFGKKDINIYGDGSQTRDFIYVDDVVRYYISCLDKENTYGKVYNMGNGIGYAIKEIASKVVEFSPETKIVYKEGRQGEQKDSFADMSKTIEDFGFRPQVNLEEGLKKTYNYIIENIEKIKWNAYY